MTDVTGAAPNTGAAEPIAATPAPAADDGGAPTAPSQGSPVDSMDDALEAIWDKHNAADGKPRDESGRFAPRGDKAAADTATANAGADKTTGQPRQEGGEQDQANAGTAIARPNAWPADKDTLWAAIPPEAREFVAQRETEAHRTISRMGNELAGYRPIGELLDAHKDVFEQRGIDFGTGLTALLDAQRRLDADPWEGLQAIAASYGIDLASTVGQQEQQYQGAGDPALQGLKRELDGVKRQLATREQAEQAEAKRQNAELQRQTKEELDTWSKDKPFYEDARRTMAVMFREGLATTLDEAYDRAVHADPQIRERMAAQKRDAASKEQKAAEERRVAEERQRREAHVSEAKRSATVNVGGSRRAVPSAPSGRWDDDRNLESIYDRAARAG